MEYATHQVSEISLSKVNRRQIITPHTTLTSYSEVRLAFQCIFTVKRPINSFKNIFNTEEFKS